MDKGIKGIKEVYKGSKWNQVVEDQAIGKKR
jgi:hypothetical protein